MLVDRRLVVLGTTALALSANPAHAQSADAHDHSGHTDAGAGPAHDHRATASLAGAAKKCTIAADACMKHCIALISKGDTSLVDCLKTVSALIPVSQALEKLASNNARRLPDLVKVVFAIAADCEVECRKHAPHHAQCKACQTACVALMEQCRKFGAA